MADGTRVPDKGAIFAFDSLLGVYQGSAGLLSATALGTQLVASGPVAAAFSAIESQITSNSVSRATWSSLLALTPVVDGTGGEVLDSDGGTHADGTATGYDGSTVDNAGRYSWNLSWGRWVRIGDTGLSAKANTEDLATVATSGNSDDLTQGTTKLLMTTSERALLGHISATGAVDLDAISDAIDGLGDLAGLDEVGESEIGTHAVTTNKIAPKAVTNDRQADMLQALIKGRSATGGTGAPQDLNAAQVLTILGVAAGADVTKNAIAAAVAIDALADDDMIPVADASDGNKLKHVAWADLKAAATEDVTPSEIIDALADGDMILVSDASDEDSLKEVSWADLKAAAIAEVMERALIAGERIVVSSNEPDVIVDTLAGTVQFPRVLVERPLADGSSTQVSIAKTVGLPLPSGEGQRYYFANLNTGVVEWSDVRNNSMSNADRAYLGAYAVGGRFTSNWTLRETSEAMDADRAEAVAASFARIAVIDKNRPTVEINAATVRFPRIRVEIVGTYFTTDPVVLSLADTSAPVYFYIDATTKTVASSGNLKNIRSDAGKILIASSRFGTYQQYGGLPITNMVEQAKLLDRANHKGTQSIATILGLEPALAGKAPLERVVALEKATAEMLDGVESEPAIELALSEQNRPETLRAFSTVLTGEASDAPALDVGKVVQDIALGKVLAITGADVPDVEGYLDIGRRMRFEVKPGETYKVSATFRRAVNPSDPNSAGVELFVKGLSYTKGSAGDVRISDPSYAVIGDEDEHGRVTISGTVGLDSDDADHALPGASKYMTVYARFHGTGWTTHLASLDLEVMQDVTIEGPLVFSGGWDASGGTFPAGAFKNNLFKVTTAGTVDGESFVVGDSLIAVVDAPDVGVFDGNWIKQDRFNEVVTAINGETGDIADVVKLNDPQTLTQKTFDDSSTEFASGTKRARFDASGMTEGETGVISLDMASRGFVSKDAAAAAEIHTGADRIWTLAPFAGYSRSDLSEVLDYPARAWFQSADGAYWLLDDDAPIADVFATTEVEGVIFSDGEVIGDDWTEAAQAWLDYYLTRHTINRDPTGSRPALPRIEFGAGQFRVSGSLNLTKFGSINRRALLSFHGASFYGDGMNRIMFDATDAQWLSIEGLIVYGMEQSPPAAGLVMGRKGTTDTAAHNAIRECGSWSSNSVPSHFGAAAVLIRASEMLKHDNSYWSNDGTAPGGIIDGINVAGFEPPMTVSGMTNDDPAVVTVTGHGLSNGDHVVFKDLDGFTLASMVYVVRNATSNTFTLEGRLSGEAISGVGAGAFVSGQVCKELYGSEFVDERAEPYSKMSFLGASHNNVVFRSAGPTGLWVGQTDGMHFNNGYVIGTERPVVMGYLNGGWKECIFDLHMEHATPSEEYITNYTFVPYADDTTTFITDTSFRENNSHASDFFLGHNGSVTQVLVTGGDVTWTGSNVSPDLVQGSTVWTFKETDLTVPTLAQFNVAIDQWSGTLTDSAQKDVYRALPAPVRLDATTNTITVEQENHTVNTGSAEITVKTINMPDVVPPGWEFTLAPSSNSNALVLDNSGNLRLVSSPRTLSSTNGSIRLRKVGANAVEVGFHDIS